MTPPSLQRISPTDSQYFFGYYDVPAFSQHGHLHLAHRVSFKDRFPTEADEAVLGVIELSAAGTPFRPFAQTRAWNFQQGSMLQWLGNTQKVIYNVIRPDRFYGSVVQDIATGTTQEFILPVANVHRGGQFALSINFNRLFDFRPGYGYAAGPDAFATVNQPADDGVYHLDLITGKTRQIISLEQIWPHIAEGAPSEKIAINHITASPSGRRFLMLVRNFPHQSGPWGTCAVTANMDGTDLRILRRWTMYSHYWWQDDQTILAWASGSEANQFYRMKDAADGPGPAVDVGFFLRDGHCSCSPDGSRILYDSYPDADRNQHLFIYDVAANRGQTIASLHSPMPASTDLRCDLHPRWDRTGRRISLDSTHEGFRGIYLLDAP